MNNISKKGFYPKFDDEGVVVMLSSSDEFSKYLAVCIQSIIDTANKDRFYDIVIFERNISEVNKDKILSLQHEDNVSVRFFSVKEHMKGFKFFLNSERISEETYYGLIIPFILNNFKKAIIMDCDMIVRHDLYDLYNTDLEGKTIGGVNDIVLNGWLNDRNGKDAWEYYKNYLKVKDPYKFFNGGLIVLNFEKYRSIYTKNDIYNYINNYQLRVVDQDVFNIMLEGDSKLIDCRWNHMIYLEGAISEAIEDASEDIKEKYFNSRKNPYVVHYAGDVKPWNDPDVEFASLFWMTARKTPFYENILFAGVERKSREIVCSHQVIYHCGVLRKIFTPYREDVIKRKIKGALNKDSFLYKVTRRIYFRLIGRPYTK